MLDIQNPVSRERSENPEISNQIGPFLIDSSLESEHFHFNTFQVNKKGPNTGREFWCCARGEGRSALAKDISEGGIHILIVSLFSIDRVTLWLGVTSSSGSSDNHCSQKNRACAYMSLKFRGLLHCILICDTPILT